jgi:threonine dehydrogenase-like Zn-dependent dehydrogenase
VYTGVEEGDIVAVWGLGPIGFMACFWAFYNCAKRVIGIDNNWRCDYAESKIPGLETINYSKLNSDESVPTKIYEMVPRGVDKYIDATGGEYGKSWTYKMELATSTE